LRWLADGTGDGAFILYEGDVLSEKSLIDYSVVHPADDKPVKMAYATQVWFNRDATRADEEPAREPTEAAQRALADPTIWIGGGTTAI
jgi:hypothetical protein